MCDVLGFSTGIFLATALFLFIRGNYWKHQYIQLIGDAFDRGSRALLTEKEIVDRATAAAQPTKRIQ